jgi:threonine dehydrogenase-like Zn-dependent dehydrogenase
VKNRDGLFKITYFTAPVHLYWQELLNEFIVPGKFDPTFMITHRVPIEDMDKLYNAFDKRTGTAVFKKYSSRPNFRVHQCLDVQE